MCVRADTKFGGLLATNYDCRKLCLWVSVYGVFILYCSVEWFTAASRGRMFNVPPERTTTDSHRTLASRYMLGGMDRQIGYFNSCGYDNIIISNKKNST